MTSSASILTITAFTVERYTAICHPLRAHAVLPLPRAVRTIIGVWLAACVTALPYPLHTRTFYYLDDPTRPGRSLADSLICNIPIRWQSRMRYFFQVSIYLLVTRKPHTKHTQIHTQNRKVKREGERKGRGGEGRVGLPLQLGSLYPPAFLCLRLLGDLDKNFIGSLFPCSASLCQILSKSVQFSRRYIRKCPPDSYSIGVKSVGFLPTKRECV